MTETLILLGLAVVALAMQLFATIRVQRSVAYAVDQKRAQFKLIWLLPVLGAAMVLAVMHQDGEFNKPTKPTTSASASSSYRANV